jgi:hypothetical protein
MALAITNLGASTPPANAVAPDITTASDATSFTIASWTPPTAGLILLVFTCNRVGGSADAATVTGNGITWTQIGSNVNASSGQKLLMFAANASGSTPGTTVIDWGANTQLHCTAVFCYVSSDIDLTGGVAGAIVQIVPATGSGTTATVNLAAAGNANNRVFAAFHHTTNEGKTARSNWTEIDDLGGTGGTRNLQTQWRSDQFEAIASATFTTSGAWAAQAVELKAVGGTPVTVSAGIQGVGIAQPAATVVALRVATVSAGVQGIGIAQPAATVVTGLIEATVSAGVQAIGIAQPAATVIAIIAIIMTAPARRFSVTNERSFSLTNERSFDLTYTKE